MLGLALSALLLAAPPTDAPKSAVEEAAITSGVLMRRELIQFGVVGTRGGMSSVPAMKVGALVLTNLATKRVIKGAHFSVEFFSSAGNRSREVSLDEDELNSLVASLSTLDAEQGVSYPKTTPQTEVFYKSRFGLHIGFLVNRGEVTGYAQLGLISPDMILIGRGEFATLKGICERVKAELAKH